MEKTAMPPSSFGFGSSFDFSSSFFSSDLASFLSSGFVPVVSVEPSAFGASESVSWALAATFLA